MSIDNELLGGWVIMKAIDGGRPDAELAGGYYWFEANRVVIGDPSSFEICQYSANPNLKPRHFDMWGGKGRDRFLQSSVYRFESDRLIICCVDGDLQDRPTGFDSTERNGWTLYELVRTAIQSPA